jgi:phytoene dehydrogenase-like protein
MSSRQKYDAIILGAGHNGLVCAGYLAKAGYKVKVLEKRSIVGGAAITEEFYPGFRNSILSFVVGLLPEHIIHEMELRKFGLRIIDRRISSFQAYDDGRHLLLTMDKKANFSEYKKFSSYDAEQIPHYEAMLSDIAKVIKQLSYQTPANLGTKLKDLARLGKTALTLRKLPQERYPEFADLFTKSAADFLEGWFESDAVKGNLALTAVVGNLVSPYHPGSSIVLLHSIYGETNGVKGAFGVPQGGMGSITQAMAEFCESKGVDISVDAAVQQVLVENGCVQGVTLEDGTTIEGKIVVSNVNPKLLFLHLMDQNDLPGYVIDRMRQWRCKGGVLRINAALSELPTFSCYPDLHPDAYTGMFKISPSIPYLERAYDDAKNGGWSKEAAIMWSIPSTLDESLAPKGLHVASIFAQHFHPNLNEGKSWDDCKHEAANSVIEKISQQVPNFRESIIGMQVISPLDLEREWGLIGGDIFHGQMHLDQMYMLRPITGHADYRGPVKNLYLCGSGTHPGGSVTGMPGYNSAREIIKDFKRRKI